MTSPQPTSLFERIYQAGKEVREALPNESWAIHTYTLAVRTLVSTFGIEWVDNHVLSSDERSPFFRNLEAAAGDESLHRARVVDLAESILNLQQVSGLVDVLKEMKAGNIEDRFAELEVGKMLALAGSEFCFVTPGGPRGSSYDLKITTPAGEVCADVKCKIESNLAISGKSILNTLKTARSQLPDDQMGAFFIKFPQSWAPDGNITPLIPILDQAASDFLRGTRRVVAIVMYFNFVLPSDGRLEVFNVYRQVFNTRHKFSDEKVPVMPLDHEPFIAPRANWIRLADACK